MGVGNIEKHSRLFAVLKIFLRLWHDLVFYRKVQYVNREKLPLSDHLIFTPNHQNALMDALAIEFSLNNQFVFVARSDIFKNKYIARLLYFFKILPVYRIRDGYESLKKNEVVFRKTLDIIRNKNGFVILPEGNHAGFRRLRPLKKGFARIAFRAEESEAFSLDMKIVPVGINYSDYEPFRSDLLVIFGEPFPVSGFYDAYRENPAVAFNQIKEKLAEEIKPLIINIESAFYDVYDFLRKAYCQKAALQLHFSPNDLYDRFRAEKAIIARLEQFEANQPGAMEKLALQVNRYQDLLQKMKLDNIKPVSAKACFAKAMLLLFAFPLFAYGYLNNFFPWNISLFVSRQIKDPQFRSSFKFVVSLLSFPLFYLIQSIAVYGLYHLFWLALAYLVSLPLSAAIAWNYAKIFRKFVSEWRYLRKKSGKDPRLAEAEEIYHFFMAEMDKIFQIYNA